MKNAREREFEKTVLMLGNFHVTKIRTACVGKYLKESEIESVLIETESFGINVIVQVLNGSDYARSTKGFLLLGEALQRLQFEAFIKQCKVGKYKNEFDSLIKLQNLIVDGKLEKATFEFENISKNSSQLLSDFFSFIEQRCSESPLFKYWTHVLFLIQNERSHSLRSFVRFYSTRRDNQNVTATFSSF